MTHCIILKLAFKTLLLYIRRLPRPKCKIPTSYTPISYKFPSKYMQYTSKIRYKEKKTCLHYAWTCTMLYMTCTDQSIKLDIKAARELQQADKTTYYRLLWRGLDPEGTLRFSGSNSFAIRAYVRWSVLEGKTCPEALMVRGPEEMSAASMRMEKVVGVVEKRMVVVMMSMKMRWKGIVMVELMSELSWGFEREFKVV